MVKFVGKCEGCGKIVLKYGKVFAKRQSLLQTVQVCRKKRKFVEKGFTLLENFKVC